MNIVIRIFPLFALLLYFLLAGSFPVQEVKLACPKGTEHRREKVATQVASKPDFPQEEEYCQKRNANGTLVKEGPYALWGPNGERQAEGQYLDDKKDGKWIRRSTSQTLEDTWRQGEFLGTKILSEPSSFVIDFSACNPHEYNIPAALGSTSYKVIGKESGNCKLMYSIEIEYSLQIELGHRPQISCFVPTDMKKLVFHNTQVGLDFSSIGQFCKK